MKRLYIVITYNSNVVYSASKNDLLSELYDMHGFGYEDEINEDATIKDIEDAAVAVREDECSQSFARIFDVTRLTCVSVLSLCHKLKTDMITL